MIHGSELSPEDFEAASHVNITDHGSDMIGDDQIEDEPLETMRETRPDRIWPGGILFYRMSKEFDKSQRAIIGRAMMEIEEKSCIRFEYARGGVENYVDVFDGVGCYSKVGMQKGQQDLSLQALKRTFEFGGHATSAGPFFIESDY